MEELHLMSRLTMWNDNLILVSSVRDPHLNWSGYIFVALQTSILLIFFNLAFYFCCSNYRMCGLCLLTVDPVPYSACWSSGCISHPIAADCWPFYLFIVLLVRDHVQKQFCQSFTEVELKWVIWLYLDKSGHDNNSNIHFWIQCFITLRTESLFLVPFI